MKIPRDVVMLLNFLDFNYLFLYFYFRCVDT